MDAVREFGPSRLATAGYAVAFVMCVVLSISLLVGGALVLLTDTAPGVLEAKPFNEPLDQAALDYAFSLLNLVVAAVLLASRLHGRPIRLLSVAMIASAGAFNLQAYAGAVALQATTGLPVEGVYRVLLPAVACAAYVLALLLFPSGQLPLAGSGVRRSLIATGLGVLLLVGVGTALLPRTLGCVVFFGFLVPLLALAVTPRHRVGTGLTMEQRTQARLLFTVVAAVLPVAAVLGLITQLWWQLGWTGPIVHDQTALAAGGIEQPTALLFWFARFASSAVAAAVLVVTRRTGLWTAERVLSLWLAATLVVALVGGEFAVVEAIAGVIAGVMVSAGILGGVVVVAVLATTLEALSFLPVHVRAERLVDRLLYGTRPTPYNVLAGITELSRSTPRNGPDLARVAEAVARGLGATMCRLTVIRPGMRDRTYWWAEAGTGPGIDDLIEEPVHHGEERIGSIAVDRGAVVGLYAQRRRLLTDIADSLGVVMQANRAGIELDRQLRAVLARAEDIAVSRRRTIAEMDSERRRIERDLHDGAQHRLVSLRLTLGLAEHQVETAQFEQARDQLDRIAEQIGSTEAVLAATATGVSSPVLAERGLVAALELELLNVPPVVLDVAGLDADRRFPAPVEAAVYFCCLESVNNACKHAPGADVVVRLATVDDRLCFTVRDEGPGYDQGARSGSPGRGLGNVQARMRAVGGRVEVRSRPGAGTAVEGCVPLPPDRSGLPEPEMRRPSRH
ncbi:sensor histidine kinase [Pseudonocardia yunnanensis]|uniref:histidine kinase n=1 Tax=Pseudonocardia yunnanensis TaxID=58107 RepID=A0ABW4F858_9PSEU